MSEKDYWRFLPPCQDVIWARRENDDPYGYTRELYLDRPTNELNARLASNDRAPHLVAQVGVPVDVVVEVLRLAGYKITPPEKE